MLLLCRQTAYAFIPVGMYTLYTLTTFSQAGAQGATR